MCHQHELTTLSLRHEVEWLLKTKAPNRSAGSAFPWFFTWFLKDYVLPAWRFSTSEDPEADDSTIRGSARDKLLVTLAAKEKAPVVTHEGSAGGAIARAAVAAGVAVFTAAEWVRSRGNNTRDLATELLKVARQQMPRFLIDRGEYQVAAAVQNCRDYLSLLELILDEAVEADFPDPLDGWKLFSR